MKKFLIPILFAGVLSSFATTTNVVYIDVNNLQDFEIQMSPETGETNVINFKVYQDRSALDLSGLTPVLYAARDEAISRNVITIEGSSSGNVATITTAGVNLSQGMSELYLRLDFRSGKNPSKYTYPYRVKGKMLILENPITQTGDPVLIGELYFAPASITNDFATVAQGAKADAALPEDGSKPMTGDLDMDGYDIDDAGVVNAERFKTTRNNLTVEILSLVPKADSKVGYIGNYDYVGADGGVGFYAVSASGTNNFDLGYLSTNNYINIQSPVISATSNILEKVTGYGTCTTNDYPVVGLVAGDRYVTFAQTNDLARTDAVDYSRFGSVVATFTPSYAYVSCVSLDLTLMYNLFSGSIQRNYVVNVFAYWRADLSTIYSFTDTSMLNTDYGADSRPKFVSKGNKLILLNGCLAESLDRYSLVVNRTNISAVCTKTYTTITTN